MVSGLMNLRDLSESLPTNYSTIINCSNETLQDSIKNVIECVCNIYVKFLQLNQEERDRLSLQGFLFDEFDKIPCATECENFKKHLRERMIIILKRDDMIHLSTDYGPEGILAEVCEGVFGKRYNFGKLFPHKTDTFIYFEDGKNELSISMSFCYKCKYIV